MNIQRMEIVRRETGSGWAMRVIFRLTAHYADREPFRVELPTDLLTRELRRGGVPEAAIDSVARWGGVLLKEEDGWKLQGK